MIDRHLLLADLLLSQIVSELLALLRDLPIGFSLPHLLLTQIALQLFHHQQSHAYCIKSMVFVNQEFQQFALSQLIHAFSIHSF